MKKLLKKLKFEYWHLTEVNFISLSILLVYSFFNNYITWYGFTIGIVSIPFLYVVQIIIEAKVKGIELIFTGEKANWLSVFKLKLYLYELMREHELDRFKRVRVENAMADFPINELIDFNFETDRYLLTLSFIPVTGAPGSKAVEVVYSGVKSQIKTKSYLYNKKDFIDMYLITIEMMMDYKYDNMKFTSVDKETPDWLKIRFKI